jgi:mono/diheme cytochrome c family protein
MRHVTVVALAVGLLASGPVLSGAEGHRLHAQETTPARTDAGKAQYAAWCAGCHGNGGDAKGLADAQMLPPPRDFRRGIFKLRTTATRNPISDAELVEIITRGIPGTAMPPFAFLSVEDRRQLAEYVATLANLPAGRRTEAVEVPPPPPSTPELVSKGQQAYVQLGCPACHGAEGRGDGPAARELKDVWGNKTPPPDFTRDPWRGGDGDRDLYLRLALGLPGTPMPAYGEAAEPEQLWALVAFVKSLRQPSAPLPINLVAQGRTIVERRHCTACHSLGGNGGTVGPAFELLASKLNFEWAAEFLVDPLGQEKVYPAYPARMPPLGLSAAEANAILAYLASVVNRPYPGQPTPPAAVSKALVVGARVTYGLNCSRCHPLTSRPRAIDPTAVPGPDLRRVSQRLDFGFLVPFLTDPKSFGLAAHPRVRKLNPDQISALAVLVWNGGGLGD